MGLQEALDYLFTPDFSKINANTWLAAVGQAFFSIGVAMAGMMTFGAYLPNSVSIPRAAITIAMADTLVAMLAGLVIFPAVFANGLDPASGPVLFFKHCRLRWRKCPAVTWSVLCFSCCCR